MRMYRHFNATHTNIGWDFLFYPFDIDCKLGVPMQAIARDDI